MGSHARIVDSMSVLGTIQNSQRRVAGVDGKTVRRQNQQESSSFAPGHRKVER